MKNKEELIEIMAEAYFEASMSFDHNKALVDNTYDTPLIYRHCIKAALKALCGALPEDGEETWISDPYVLNPKEVLYEQLKEWGEK